MYYFIFIILYILNIYYFIIIILFYVYLLTGKVGPDDP